MNKCTICIVIIKELKIKPLSINEAFQGRRFKTQKCKDFERDIFKLLNRQEIVKGKVEINYRFYLVNHALTDYDNLIKVMQDCIVKAGYIEDDRKIYKASQEKIPSKENIVIIEIKKYDR